LAPYYNDILDGWREGYVQNTDTNRLDELYRTYRAYLFRIAYRMLGSISDTEDLVHDVFIAMQSVDIESIENMKAYLSRLVINRSLNLLKSAHKQREMYVGPWLPETLVMTERSPLAELELDESLSYAYMVMLEQLKPVERVVFILREALDYEYAEIAHLLGITEAYSRKVLSRARKKVRMNEGQQPPSFFSHEQERVQRFLEHFTKGNIEQLTDLLSEDVVIQTDGGGKVRAAINPIFGRTRVLIFLSALHSRGWKEASARVVTVNGEPGILFVDEHGVKAVVCFQWADNTDLITNIFAVLNPDKLTSIVL